MKLEILNAWADAWWFWLAHASWQSALVAVVVIGLVWLGRRWPAPLRYALLLVALVKFAMPPMFSLPTGIFSIAGPELPAAKVEIDNKAQIRIPTASSDLGGGESVPIIRPDSSTAPPNVFPEIRRALPLSFRWQTWLMLIHAIGTLAALGWILWQWRSLQAWKRNAARITAGSLYDLFAEVARELDVRRLPSLLVSGERTAPAAFGILKPTILLPTAVTEQFPHAELKSILAHELAHFRRGDLRMNSVQLALLVVWWFHPMFWLLQRAIRKTREDCCDDLLLAREVTSSDTYCEALVSAARQLASPSLGAAALGFGENLHPLGRRLSRIMDQGLKRSARLPFWGMLLIVVVSGALLPGLRSQEVPSKPPRPETKLPIPSTAGATNPVPPMPPNAPAWVAEQMRADREPPVATPDIKAKSVPELYREMKVPVTGGTREKMMHQEFRSRGNEALLCVIEKLGKTAPVPTEETKSERRKAIELLRNLVTEVPNADARAVSLMLATLDDPDAQVAGTAATILGRSLGKSDEVAPALLDAAKRGNRQAVLPLVHFANDSEAMAKTLLGLFQDRNQSVVLRTHIAFGFGMSASSKHQAAVERAFVAEFPSADRRLQRTIASALWRLGAESPDASAVIERAYGKSVRPRPTPLDEFSGLSVDEIMECIREPRIPGETTKAVLYLGLRRRFPETEVLAALRECLRMPDAHVRLLALQSLAGLRMLPNRQVNPAPVPLLLEALNDSDAQVRERAMVSLGMFAPHVQAALPKLRASLRAEDAHERLQAAVMLRRLEPKIAEELTPIFLESLSDPQRDTDQRTAARTLGEMGHQAAGAIPSLQRIAGEAKGQLRSEAENAVKRIQAELNKLSL